MADINILRSNIDRDDFLKHFGEHIKNIREQKGITAMELAQRIDIERSQISRIENGKANPSVISLLVICKALDISFQELFDGFTYT